MNQSLLVSVRRGIRKTAVSILIGSALSIALPAQTAVTQLETVVTTATRTPVFGAQLGSAVDRISAADLQRRQINTLAGALDTIPGTPNFASGASGAVTSVFMRGAKIGRAHV